MRCPTWDQEVAGSTPAKVGNILSWRLILKYFLRLFSPFYWFKKGSCHFLAKECTQYWLTCQVNMWLGKLAALDMTPLGWLGRKTSTQINTNINYTYITLKYIVQKHRPCHSKTDFVYSHSTTGWGGTVYFAKFWLSNIPSIRQISSVV